MITTGGASPPPDTQPPTAPGNLAVTNASATSLTLGWTAATDDTAVTGYNLYNGATKVATVGSPSYAFTGLGCGSTYTLGVEAFDAAGNISPRPTLDASTAACADTQAPTAPSNLTVTNTTATSLTLGWTAATDNTAVTGYNLYNGATKVATVSSAFVRLHRPRPAAPPTRSESRPSTQQVTPLRGPASAPATASCSPASTTFAAAADAYVVGGTTNQNNGTATTLRIKPSFPAETGYLKFNVSGLTGAVQSATPQGQRALRARWGFDAYTTSSSWTESGTHLPERALRAATNLGSFPSGTLTGWISLDVTPAVTANGTYSFALVGTYWQEISLAARESGANAPQLVVTTSGPPPPTDAQAPTAPANLVQTGSSTTSISLSWSAATDNVGVTGYGLYLNGTATTPATTTNTTISSLACGTSYQLAVDAYDAAGNRSAQTTTTATTTACPTDTQAPTAPSNLNITNATTTSLTLGWTTATDNTAVTGYNLYRSSTSGFTPSAGNRIAQPTATSYTDSGLAAGTYYYRATARDAAGNESLPSAQATGTVTTGGAPAPVPVPAAEHARRHRRRGFRGSLGASDPSHERRHRLRDHGRRQSLPDRR